MKELIPPDRSFRGYFKRFSGNPLGPLVSHVSLKVVLRLSSQNSHRRLDAWRVLLCNLRRATPSADVECTCIILKRTDLKTGLSFIL
jgi:hypothetical protein